MTLPTRGVADLAPTMIVADLVRTTGGKKVHRRSCRHNVNAAPWDYADGRTVGDLLIEAPWTSPCGVCKPYTDLNAPPPDLMAALSASLRRDRDGI